MQQEQQYELLVKPTLPLCFCIMTTKLRDADYKTFKRTGCANPSFAWAQLCLPDEGRAGQGRAGHTAGQARQIRAGHSRSYSCLLGHLWASWWAWTAWREHGSPCDSGHSPSALERWGTCWLHWLPAHKHRHTHFVTQYPISSDMVESLPKSANGNVWR